jgi:hypothetical protein
MSDRLEPFEDGKVVWFELATDEPDLTFKRAPG